MKYDDIFEKAFEYMLENEGGFVNDKDDKGGATKYGVSLRLMKSMFDQGSIWLDLHEDGKIDEKDVMKLSLDDAKKIYYDEFWCRGIDKVAEINPDIGIKLFDMAVNLGVGQAVKLFQKNLDILSHYEYNILYDGIIGPKTLTGIKSISCYRYQSNLMEDLACDLIEYYQVLCVKNSSMYKYLVGWTKRALRFPR